MKLMRLVHPMSLMSFLLVSYETHKSHDTQTTSKTGTMYHETHNFRCRIIGLGGREYNKTPKLIRISQGNSLLSPP